MTESIDLSSKVSDKLSRLVLSAKMKSAKLSGIRESDQFQYDQLIKEVSEAKGRLLLSDEISRVFEALQDKALERSVGSFEKLLSAILSDVLPDEGSIKLVPEFKNNTTALDVLLEKGLGELEDVLDANGGAMTNVVSTGFRYIALSRTKNRKLMVLDEPDCWIKPGRVPAFINVISEISAATKTQSFIISHHDYSFFEGVTNIVKLKKDEDSGLIYAEAVAPLVNEWESDEQKGIRAIELINFRKHEHTYIPLFPGATTLIGDNNLGKSTALVSALKAVCYGESSSTVIRHHQVESTVIIHLENQTRVEWKRHLNKSPLITYRLIKKEEGVDVVLAEAKPKRGEVPDFVLEHMGIVPIDDLDIQIGNQKSPVFLLNETATKRAQILSVGKESSYLKVLMKKYETIKSADRETVKYGEASAKKLDYRLGVLSKLDGIEEKLAQLLNVSDDLIAKIRDDEQLDDLITSINRLSSTLGTLDALVSKLELPVLPTLIDTDAIGLIGKELSSKKIFEEISIADVIIPAAPELLDTDKLIATGKDLSDLTKKVTIIGELLESLPSEPIAPVLFDTNEAESVFKMLEQTTMTYTSASSELESVTNEYLSTELEINSIKEALGTCPLCDTPFNLGHSHS